jgi:hypothetical protein
MMIEPNAPLTAHSFRSLPKCPNTARLIIQKAQKPFFLPFNNGQKLKNATLCIASLPYARITLLNRRSLTSWLVTPSYERASSHFVRLSLEKGFRCVWES